MTCPVRFVLSPPNAPAQAATCDFAITRCSCGSCDQVFLTLRNREDASAAIMMLPASALPDVISEMMAFLKSEGKVS
jgi:hypothetical protein